MKTIKCNVDRCTATKKVEDDCEAWFCIPCSELILKNLKEYLDTQNDQIYQDMFWGKSEKPE